MVLERAYVVWKMIDPAKLFDDDRLDLGFQLCFDVGIGHVFFTTDTLGIVLDQDVRQDSFCDVAILLTLLPEKDLTLRKTMILICISTWQYGSAARKPNKQRRQAPLVTRS
jgi:hypothetical protein